MRGFPHSKSGFVHGWPSDSAYGAFAAPDTKYVGPAAAVGAGIGTAIFPGPGTAIGGAIGTIVGFVGPIIAGLFGDGSPPYTKEAQELAARLDNGDKDAIPALIAQIYSVTPSQRAALQGVLDAYNKVVIEAQTHTVNVALQNERLAALAAAAKDYTTSPHGYSEVNHGNGIFSFTLNGKPWSPPSNADAAVAKGWTKSNSWQGNWPGDPNVRWIYRDPYGEVEAMYQINQPGKPFYEVHLAKDQWGTGGAAIADNNLVTDAEAQAIHDYVTQRLYDTERRIGAAVTKATGGAYIDGYWATPEAVFAATKMFNAVKNAGDNAQAVADAAIAQVPAGSPPGPGSPPPPVYATPAVVPDESTSMLVLALGVLALLSLSRKD